MKARKICLAIALLCCSAALQGQGKAGSFERISWQNCLFQSDNAAFIRMSDTIFTALGGSVTNLAAGITFENGAFRNWSEAENSTSTALDIQSYTRFGKLYLHGSFGYGYDWMNNVRLCCLSDPCHSPFMLTDTIPGNASNEVYRLQASAALPLGESLTLATDLRYTDGMMAKKKDLRNLNTLMNFELRPALSYVRGPIKAGAFAGIRRRTETIEYMQVDDATEKYLFEISGLWICNALGYSSSETARYKQTSSYLAGAQVQLDSGNLKWTTEFALDRSYDRQGETKYNNLKAGDYETLLINGCTSLQAGLKHRISARWSDERGAAYKYLQMQELDNASMVRKWVDYARFNCYFDKLSDISAAYTFRQAESLTDIRWEASAGFEIESRNRTYEEYPQLFCQNYRTISATASYTRYFKFNNMNMQVTPQAVWAASPTGTMLETVTEDETLAVSQSGTREFILTSALEQEYGYATADVLSAGLSVRLDRQLRKTSVYGVLSTKVRSGNIISNSDVASATIRFRSTSNLTIGFIF